MASPDKVAAVAELTERFTSSTGAVLTEYRGLSVKALKDLRRALGDNATYAVSKNTLTQIAAREAGVSGVEEHLVGPTAIAFIAGDPVNVAKGLRDFARTHPMLVIKGGVLEGKSLTADDVRKLADLESREVLLAKVAGGMQGVLQQAISLISAPLSQAARLFAALQEQRGGQDQGSTAEADPGSDAPDSTPAAPAAESQPEAATAVEEPIEAAPAAEEPTEAAPAAEEFTEAAPAAAEPTEAAPAAAEPTEAAPAAEEPTEAAPAAEDQHAAAAAEDN